MFGQCGGGHGDYYGAFLTGLLIAVTGLVMAVRDRRPAVLPKLAASCIPCIVVSGGLLWSGSERRKYF